MALGKNDYDDQYVHGSVAGQPIPRKTSEIVAYSNGYAGGYGPNKARDVGQFYRLGSTRLQIIPVGRAIPSGFSPSGESWERVSDPFVFYDGADSGFNLSDAMALVASSWATHAGSSAATLKAAIHADLNAAGYGDQYGEPLT